MEKRKDKNCCCEDNKKECDCEKKHDCECEKNLDSEAEKKCKCAHHDEDKNSSNESNGKSKEEFYLDLAQRLQAEFENFRKRTHFEMIKAKEDGQVSVIEAFLPALDTFKLAEKSISDDKVLEGVKMIELSILEALKKLEVEKIEAIGKKYDPNLHTAIAVACVGDKDNDIILDEYQAGYKFKDRVIRYSKVIVNKKED